MQLLIQLFMIVCWKVFSNENTTGCSANSLAITSHLPIDRYLPLLLRAPLVFVAPFFLWIAALIFFFFSISTFEATDCSAVNAAELAADVWLRRGRSSGGREADDEQCTKN